MDPATPRNSLSPLQRLRSALHPRGTRAQVLAGLLCALLGFALVVQVRQTQAEGLSSLSQEELVRLLDDVNERSDRLEEEARQLQQTRDELLSGSNSAQVAAEEARSAAQTYGILAGTLPATGPGIRLVVRDPQGAVGAAMFVDTLQELRDAGAEAVQVGDVRVVASTSFVDGPQGVLADGTALSAPYHWVVIGDPQTMASALAIPGGVLAALDTHGDNGAEGEVTLLEEATVDALRTLPAPEYARPATPAPDP